MKTKTIQNLVLRFFYEWNKISFKNMECTYLLLVPFYLRLKSFMWQDNQKRKLGFEFRLFGSMEEWIVKYFCRGNIRAVLWKQVERQEYQRKGLSLKDKHGFKAKSRLWSDHLKVSPPEQFQSGRGKNKEELLWRQGRSDTGNAGS